MAISVRRRISGEHRRGDLRGLVRTRLGARYQVEEADIADLITLKSFDKSDGSLLWERRLDNPVLATDGHIYGYHLQEDTTDEALNSTIIRLSGASAGNPLRVAPTSGVQRFKKRVRKIAIDGAFVADSSFWWFTDNGGYVVSPIELPPQNLGWVQDCFGATADGELLMMQGDNSTGAFAFGGESLICWDSANTTTTRRYTIVAAAVRNLTTVPSGGTKMRFRCENDGTNAEQTIDVPDMIGKTAADLATALEAFPHIVSATGTGGPYPYVNIDLEIEWAQDTYHFKLVQRLESTSRSVRTWLRDWDTAEIMASVANPSTVNSTAALWQLTEDDQIIGISTNPASGLGTPVVDGIAIEKFTRSGFDYSQVWRTRPTESRGPIWGPPGRNRAAYSRPAIRNGVLVVGHDIARGADQATGLSSNWHEINLSTGALVSNGTSNNGLWARPTFASDSKLLAVGWDSFLNNSYAGTNYQCDRAPVGYAALMSALNGSTRDWFGPYGIPFNTDSSQVAADTTAIYSCSSLYHGSALSGGGWNGDTQFVINGSDPSIMTVITRNATGYTSRVSPDGYFSLANYYRIQLLLQSPINHRWISAGMDWRVAFFTVGTSISSGSTPAMSTDWLAFDADETDLQAALDALLGSNDAGANAFVEGPNFIQGATEPIPQMIWQRGITLTSPATPRVRGIVEVTWTLAAVIERFDIAAPT